jgi:phosphopantothenoylcysteine decarboxylase / phosphopantothenate---cysteine ligase
MLQGRTVVLGVSGGIAAYKACELTRWLRKQGAAVVVVMTDAAAEFVTPLTFETLSGNPVVRGMWGSQRPRFELPPRAAGRVHGQVEHIDLAEAADLVVIAPATANLMARLVHGEAPDALTAVALAARAPLVVCPAMDAQMWRHPATRENVSVLRRRGATIVEPETGSLASGLEGPGRLASLEAITAAIEKTAARRAGLEGARVLVGAGRSEEPLDPVRVLSNRSSGRMGCALAEAARDRGAEVVLVAGPMSVEPPFGVKVVAVRTAKEMEKAMSEHAALADVVVMAAAVADYRPARASAAKISSGAQRLSLELVPNPDILAGLCARRRPGQVLVGFALETSAGVARARKKLAGKGVDLMVLNRPEEGLGGDTNRVTLVEAGRHRALPRLSKREVAEAVLDRALELRATRSSRAARPGRAAARGAGKKP